MHKKKIIQAGKKLSQARKALIMLHGRGARADDILSLSNSLNVKDFVLLAPQAANYTWYPYSFLSPPEQNEPWLSSALALIHDIVSDIKEAGITNDKIFFLGFSQGACLTLEFIARNAARWGGAVAFTGGLIGDRIYPERYTGNLSGTPVFIGSSDTDPHVTLERVHASTNILKMMHADVIEKIYPNMGHTVNVDEIATVNNLIFK